MNTTFTFILPFSSPHADLAQAGGKGASLAALARAGFPVPPGFVVVTAAYQAFLESNHLMKHVLAFAQGVTLDDPASLDEAAAQINALFTQGQMPPAVAAAITAAYQDLVASDDDISHSAVAVRSSATTEDLPGLSFAGQQETYLNVIGATAVLDAVKACWASLWTARAMGYRAHSGIPPEAASIAVVVQKMIPADTSGVLFTANPLTGRRDEIVIDASFGLGEAIVSGQVEPDHYVVDPHGGRITERRLGAKALAVVPRSNGGTDKITHATRAQQQALSDEQILALARLAQRVAEHYGSPQDIEWAWAQQQLYLLQSRPITSLYPLPQVEPDEDRRGSLRAYFSFNGAQGMTDPATPLGLSVWHLIFSAVFHHFGIRRPTSEVIPIAGDRLYMDMTDLARDPRLRPVLLALLERADPGAKQAMVELIAQGRFPSQRMLSAGQSVRFFSKFTPLLVRMLAALAAPERARRQAIAYLDRHKAQVKARMQQVTDLATCLAVMQNDLGREFVGAVRIMAPIVFPGAALISVIDRWLGRWLGEPTGGALALMRGVPDNVTTEMDLKLWVVAQTIRADVHSAQVLRHDSVEAIVEAYRRAALPAVLQRALADFLAAYGMRANAEIDIGRPRWREDPTPIVQMLRGYLQLEDPRLAPDVVYRQRQAEAMQLATQYVDRVRQTRFGFVRSRLLSVAIRRMRLLGAMRELPKFFLIQLLDVYRTALLASGRTLACRGELQQPEDIFFLPLNTLKQVAQGSRVDLRSIVAQERDDYERERRRRLMPRVLLSTGEAFYEGVRAEGRDELPASANGAGSLAGQPVSPGVAEGRVRIVLDPHGARLEPGEVLVCPATDPGWTPLFLTASALVMEMGGLVTHGAVVAREYGIPAVVGVHEATQRLVTGQRVRVDGTRGRVKVLAGSE